MPAPNQPFVSVKIIGTLYEDNVMRDRGDNSAVNFLAFNNGTTIPNGSYRVLFRALKNTGNPDLEGDYETWMAPILIVKRN